MGLYEVTEMRYMVSYKATYFDQRSISADNMEHAKKLVEEALSNSQAISFEVTSAVCLDGPEPINRKDLIHR